MLTWSSTVETTFRVTGDGNDQQAVATVATACAVLSDWLILGSQGQTVDKTDTGLGKSEAISGLNCVYLT